jgi:hypothetical protein
MTRRDQRRQRGGGGRVLDVAVPAVGQAEQLPHPVGHAKLELVEAGDARQTIAT